MGAACRTCSADALSACKASHASQQGTMQPYKTQKTPIKKTGRDYRPVAFCVVAAYIALLLFAEWYFGSYTRIMKYLMSCPAPYFIDTQVLLTGIEAVRQGLDPYSPEANINLPLGFYNYPLSWTWLSFLPFLKMSNTISIGLALMLAFFVALYFFIGKINLPESVAYAVLFTSSAFVLGVERGNSDLIIFLLLLIPIFRHGSQKLLVLTALAAGILKLFPIAGLAGLLYHLRQRRKQTVLLIAGAAVLFLAYVFIMKDNLLSVSRVTPRPFEGLCYGLGTVPSYLQKLLNARSLYVWPPYLLLLLAGLVAFYFTTRSSLRALCFCSDKFGLAHIIGSSVFAASCLIGYNWEYRLVFLILTIPQTLRWVREKRLLPTLSILLTVAVMEQSLVMTNLDPRLSFRVFYFLLSQLFAVLLFLYHAALLAHFAVREIAELKTR